MPPALLLTRPRVGVRQRVQSCWRPVRQAFLGLSRALCLFDTWSHARILRRPDESAQAGSRAASATGVAETDSAVSSHAHAAQPGAGDAPARGASMDASSAGHQRQSSMGVAAPPPGQRYPHRTNVRPCWPCCAATDDSRAPGDANRHQESRHEVRTANPALRDM